MTDMFDRLLAARTKGVLYEPGSISPIPQIEAMPTVSKTVNGGVQHIYKFSNGYSASVVQHEFSYGHEDGLWELAIIGPNGRICYDTPITEDVLGYQSDADVANALVQINALPSAVNPNG